MCPTTKKLTKTCEQTNNLNSVYFSLKKKIYIYTRLDPWLVVRYCLASDLALESKKLIGISGPPTNIGLISSVGRALVRYPRGRGFESSISHIFFARISLYINEIRAKRIWLMPDSNPRPLEYCTSALPTEIDIYIQV